MFHNTFKNNTQYNKNLNKKTSNNLFQIIKTKIILLK